jgi:hypothetical protein
MKRILGYMALTIMGITLISCVTSSQAIKSKSISDRAGVFSETTDGTPPQGYADIVIKASIKTPLEGYYPLESEKSLRGKTVYPVVFNIGGQAVTWDMKGERESAPLYNMDAKTSHDPEAGVGMKYYIEKKVRLISGTHKIFFGLPGEKYYTETEVSLKDRETYYMVFAPVYKYKSRPHRIPTFLKGIKNYEIYLDENRIQQSNL